MIASERDGSICGFAGQALRFILGGGAIAGSIICIYSCEFFAYRTLDGQPWEALAPPFDTLNKAAVGFFAYSEATNDENVLFGDSCLKYPEWSEVGQSNLFLVAQWCAISAAVAGFLGWTVITADVCFFDSAATTVMSAFFFFAAAALQLSTFLVFGDTEFCLESSSQNKCRFGSGAWYSLGAAGAYGILFCLTLVLPRSQNINLCCCRKNANEIDDQEKQGEEDHDETSEDDLIEENESGIDVYSKDSGTWTLEEQVTYDPPSSPPISPTSALTLATFDDEVEESPSVLLAASPATLPTTLPATTRGKQGQEGEKEQGFMDMLCGDPLQVATSFSMYGEGVRNNLHTLALHKEYEKATAVKERETEETA